MQKQGSERRKTSSFLHYALGKREEMSNKEIVMQSASKIVNIQSDPLMPGILRKASVLSLKSMFSRRGS